MNLIDFLTGRTNLKVSGFSIVRNGIKYGYPFREAILSILPLCDEFIINVGKSDDETLDVIRSIGDEKLMIFESDWDMSLNGGQVLSVETNRALDKCTGDWCFYIQADEVLHEKYFDAVRSSMVKYCNEDKVEGLRFKYEHFYGSYDYIQDNYRNWYIREVRIIKNSDDIVSWGDAMDFRHRDGSKISMKDIDAKIYHYGWVRPPDKLLKKRKDFELLYTKGEIADQNMAQYKNYDDLGNLQRFTETHPEVMKELIVQSEWDFDAKLEDQHPDWIRAILIFLHPLTKRIRKLFAKS
ncbi:MAG: glycosyltransferase family 2 protein [Ignavibacteria bacterium]|nr:glycosyltransferase family 2 protein [Ignavibacteria bacterium]MBK9227768.1 glycosyltransferase family 2 protein [Ignavibacteria bacterium]